MRKAVWPMLALLLILLSTAAHAGTFYEHEEEGYWWFVESNPAYELVIPSTASGYIERDFFGQKSVELYFGPTGRQFVIASVVSPSVTTEKIKAMAVAMYGHLFTNIKVEADRTITTSAGTQAYFYAITGSTPAARQGMLRLVVFRSGSKFAWLVLSCYANEYDSNATVRNHWLTAVNSFVWTSN